MILAQHLDYLLLALVYVSQQVYLILMKVIQIAHVMLIYGRRPLHLCRGLVYRLCL